MATSDIGDVRRDSPEWKPRTVWSLLSEVAATHGEKVAIVSVDTTGRETLLTYGELLSRADDLAAGLVSLGVRHGDRTCLWMTNLPEWIMCYLACLKIGATAVPINTWLKQHEIAYILGKSRVRHLIMLDRFRKIEFPAIFRAICPEWESTTPGALFSPILPELRNVVILGREGGTYPGSFSFAEIAKGGTAADAALVRSLAAAVAPNDLALINFTSGSTSFPKGALLEQWGIVTNALLHTKRLETHDRDRWFSAMPFFHAGGSIWAMMSALSRGSQFVFLEAWDPELAVTLLEREACSVFWGAAAMLRDVLAKLAERPRRLSVRLAAAGDPGMGAEIRAKLGAKAVFAAYGLTEGYGPQTLQSPADPHEKQDFTNGRPLDGIEIRVVDPVTHAEVPVGALGEAWIRGLRTRGYFDLAEETEKAIDAEGWYHSKDLVVRDAEGFITFAGRLMAMIKVGGENVAAEEVETTIRAHPGVKECCVIGVADPRKTEACRAYIVADHGLVTAEALREFCAQRLASFKVPRDIILVPALPMTGSGKVDRATLVLMDREGSIGAVSS